jgi:hypothetical protein
VLKPLTAHKSVALRRLSIYSLEHTESHELACAAGSRASRVSRVPELNSSKGGGCACVQAWVLWKGGACAALERICYRRRTAILLPVHTLRRTPLKRTTFCPRNFTGRFSGTMRNNPVGAGLLSSVREHNRCNGTPRNLCWLVLISQQYRLGTATPRPGPGFNNTQQPQSHGTLHSASPGLSTGAVWWCRQSASSMSWSYTVNPPEPASAYVWLNGKWVTHAYAARNTKAKGCATPSNINPNAYKNKSGQQLGW